MNRVGVDVVDLASFRQMLTREPELVSDLFTPAEREYAMQSDDPVPRLAARFAAKEAAMKALGVGIDAVEWQHIGVERAEGGAPELRVIGSAHDLALLLGVIDWAISLSHSDLVAVAIVVAEVRGDCL